MIKTFYTLFIDNADLEIYITVCVCVYMYAGKPYLSILDLLVLTSLDQLIFILKILFKFFIKRATLMRSQQYWAFPLS